MDEENDSDCSLFNVFYDIPTPLENCPTLVTIISGASIAPYHSMSTSEIVKGFFQINICCITKVSKGAMAALKSIFKEVDVPEPVEFFATKWGQEEFSQMSYSYVKIGASGTDYDVLAQPHTERVLFAGEATNRHFPQTGKVNFKLFETYQIQKSRAPSYRACERRTACSSTLTWIPSHLSGRERSRRRMNQTRQNARQMVDPMPGCQRRDADRIARVWRRAMSSWTRTCFATREF